MPLVFAAADKNKRAINALYSLAENQKFSASLPLLYGSSLLETA
jgi:hypothetical protein